MCGTPCLINSIEGSPFTKLSPTPNFLGGLKSAELLYFWLLGFVPELSQYEIKGHRDCKIAKI